MALVKLSASTATSGMKLTELANLTCHEYVVFLKSCIGIVVHCAMELLTF